MKISNRYLRTIVVVQFALITILSLYIYSKSRDPLIIPVNMGECSAGIAEYIDGSFVFDGSDNKVIEVSDLFRTASFPLKAGAYTLIVDYDASEDQLFRIMDERYTDWIKYPTGYLRRGETRLLYDFTADTDLSAAGITVQYIPSGGWISVHDIYIIKSCRKLIQLLVTLIGFFVLSDLAYINRHKFEKSRNTVLALIGLTLLISLPLSISGISGIDLPYSLLRIEGLYKSLINGEFPARMNAFILDGAGYPSSVYYGDIFLYPAAFLRMACFDVTQAWKIYVFLLNAATVLTAYFSFGEIGKDNRLKLILTFAYCSAPFHLESIYYRAALGEVIAYIFFPIIVNSLYGIYTQELCKDNIRRLSTRLAIGISAVVCSHILSAEMMVILMLILILFLGRKTFDGSVLAVFAGAVIKTILISAYFLIPFLDYYFSISTRISDTVEKTLIPLQDRGAYISEFFSFLTYFDKGGRVPFNPDGPGLILIAAFLFGVVRIVQNKTDGMLKISVLMSAVTMFLASNLFPWNFLTAHTGIGRIMAQIQHPTRYINLLVAILILVLHGVLMNQTDGTKRICLMITVFFTIFSISVFSSQYEASAATVHPVNSNDLDCRAVGNGEYVLKGTDFFQNPYTLAAQNNQGSVTSMVNHGVNMSISCSNGDSDKSIIVPRYNYRYYTIHDENGRELEKANGENNLISFNLPASYRGNIYIEYSEPWTWRLSELISLVTIILIAFHTKRFKLSSL